MGRKKGGRNVDTPERIEAVAQKVLEEGKSVKECAEELGLHRNSVSRTLQKGMADEEVKARINRSRDRLLKMLSLSDGAYLRTLKYNKPENFANQINVASKIYKTFGLIREEPIISITNIIPIKVEVENREYTIATGNTDSSSSESGESV